jgi:hypothetical protein
VQHLDPLEAKNFALLSIDPGGANNNGGSDTQSRRDSAISIDAIGEFTIRLTILKTKRIVTKTKLLCGRPLTG